MREDGFGVNGNTAVLVPPNFAPGAKEYDRNTAILKNLETQSINQSSTNSLAWASTSHSRHLSKAKD